MPRYQADRAVELRSEDLLGRSRFAEAIADAFVAWREDVSLVVGLHGEWGSGKTSIKNFVVDALQPPDGERRLDVIEIKPWELSGTHNIEAHFFDKIAAFLQRKDASAQDQEIAKWWSAVAAALGVGESLVEPISRPVSTSLLALGLATTIWGSWNTDSPRWMLTVAAIALFGHLLATSRTIAQRVSDLFQTRSQRSKKSTAETKSELAKLLGARKVPLLIVIDEIDRLSNADEMRLIFRLVKANGDLPKMLYLLILDRTVVARAIEPNDLRRGEGYLEKIIQAPFDVPAVQRPLLTHVLLKHLDGILENVTSGEIDTNRWLDLYHQQLWVFFESLRDVYRFLSAFEFQVGVFRERHAFEVNPVDLFALEVLRLFEPELYGALAREMTLLTRGSLHAHAWGSSDDSDEAKTRLTNLIARATENRREVVKNIISDLFPRTAWAFGGTAYHSDFDGQWSEDKRVCSSTHFEKYFYATVPEGDIRQIELDDFIASTGSRAAVRRELQRFKADGRIERFLLRLQSEQQRIPIDNAVPFLTALFDEGDDLPHKIGVLQTEASELLQYVAFALLSRLTRSDREAVLDQVLRNTDSLYTVARRLLYDEPKHDQTENDNTFGTEAFQRLAGLWVEKARAAAASGVIMEYRRLTQLLYFWKEWGDPEEPRAWCATAVANPMDAAKLAARFVSYATGQGVGSVVARRHPYLDMSTVDAFIDAAAVDKQLSSLADELLDDEQKLGRRLLRNAMRRRREGKPDQGPLQWSDDDDDRADA